MKKGNPWALLPFFVFLVLFIGSGIVLKDFYAFPVIVAITISSMVALAMNRKVPFTKKVDIFCQGAGNSNVMLMALIFLLAGAFSSVAKGMGAVDATVNFALSIIPQNFLIIGLFIIACFISLAMGTSVGTIVALVPIGLGISEHTGLAVALVTAAVIGGAMFGDNLSIISDTTITAVRTQGAQMKDKFRVNFWIVLPAAFMTSVIFGVLTWGEAAPITHVDYSLIKIVPYLIVIVLALMGMNVFFVLTLGITLAGVVGLVDGSYQLLDVIQQVGDGMAGMYNMAFLAILIAGMVEIIKFNGGIEFILQAIMKRISTSKGAEFGIAGLVALTNLATANNTIAILIAGPLAKDIATQYNIEPRKAASLLDVFSCMVQGVLPYGAQFLVAASLAGISPINILPYSFYPVLIGICGAVAIMIGYPKKTFS
ncbi:sodium:proton antiporter [Lysinibacillus sp. BF-4]|uniref:Na+/H+ antiporter NhaC family protein n=1 Tax=Lysinibacillus sp. BF-4 TaxID=1473546 RepID=UPI0004FF65DA|nr:Na+/H+ antiporter NhaC family protein [Lysinibacillus sp. BF-4]KFL43407.1 sodium:proton antiporter [Lysinibacillus sp. BF-4]